MVTPKGEIESGETHCIFFFARLERQFINVSWKIISNSGGKVGFYNEANTQTLYVYGLIVDYRSNSESVEDTQMWVQSKGL